MTARICFRVRGEEAVTMRVVPRLMGAMALCVLALSAPGTVAAPKPATAATAKPVTLEFFSWSIFRITSPEGTVVLTNPFVTNPDSPVKVADFPKVDAIVVADGHRDEVGSTDEIALATGAKIITSFEMFNVWFEPRKVPVEQVMRSGPGDTEVIKDVTIRNVGSVHGSGTADKMDGGKAMGFFIKFKNGPTVYFAGSTDTTLDCSSGGGSTSPTSPSSAFRTAATPRTWSSRRASCAPATPTSRR
jgi:hypothetical protein